MFRLHPAEIVYAVGSQYPRGLVLIGSIQQRHLPTECRRRNTRGPDRMADIVVAVAKRPLAVLPGFPPMD